MTSFLIILQAIASSIGYVILAITAVALIMALVYGAFVLCPFRFEWVMNPVAKWKVLDVQHDVTKLIGIGARRKRRWFIGFIAFNPRQDPTDSRILATKTEVERVADGAS